MPSRAFVRHAKSELAQCAYHEPSAQITPVIMGNPFARSKCSAKNRRTHLESASRPHLPPGSSSVYCQSTVRSITGFMNDRCTRYVKTELRFRVSTSSGSREQISTGGTPLPNKTARALRKFHQQDQHQETAHIPKLPRQARAFRHLREQDASRDLWVIRL